LIFHKYGRNANGKESKCSIKLMVNNHFSGVIHEADLASLPASTKTLTMDAIQRDSINQLETEENVWKSINGDPRNLWILDDSTVYITELLQHIDELRGRLKGKAQHFAIINEIIQEEA